MRPNWKTYDCSCNSPCGETKCLYRSTNDGWLPVDGFSQKELDDELEKVGLALDKEMKDIIKAINLLSPPKD